MVCLASIRGWSETTQWADVAGARRAGVRAILADGFYGDSVGMTVLEAAQEIVSRGGPAAD